MKHYSQVGRKVTLWDEKYSSNAYKDQFGISHAGYVVMREIYVTIIEEKLVPSMWGSSREYYGWKAVSEDGTEYTCNWNQFPDDSMTPTYYWDTRDDDGYLWTPVDAEQAMFIHVDPSGNLKTVKNTN